MEERYEIKSKIGQGGFGSVYRALDKRMNREVAIKRINTSDEDGMLEEASRQLSKEAGALASMQHPNIITIYDVGSDEDGPYVVMELLSGSPLDDLVDNAPLTWEDFRELALQTQEALIGAQELDLVHRDIKPANVMLTWLPSGKFQVKLLDFGLAKLTQRPSLQTLNQADSIFGSIFFMSPEQFERAPIDRRTDMYAMGCVYYYALTGSHPFDGATAVQVMSAHLHHDFVPLDEVRPDMPRWVCDWVMWHMNRYPDDRPASAREALQVFVQNDKFPPVEAPAPAPAPQPSNRPRLLIPGAEPLVPGAVTEWKPEPTGPVAVITKTAPQPLVPPTGKPSIHSSRQLEIEQAQKPTEEAPGFAPVEEAPEVEEPVADEATSEPEAAPVEEEPPAQPPAPKTFVATQKRPSVAPPFGGVPSQTASQPTVEAETAPQKPPTLIRRPTVQPGVKPTTGTAPVVARTGPPTGPFAPTQPATGPQPVISPAVGSQTGAFPTAPGSASSQLGTQPALTQTGSTAVMPAPPKPGMPIGVKIAIAAVIALLVVLTGFFVVQKLGNRKAMAEYNEIIRLAAHPETQSVPMNKAMLDMMLRTAMSVGSNMERETVFRALFLATSTDGTDIDAEIVRFVTQQQMMESVRNVLISQVLRRRENPAIVTPMLAFAAKTDNDEAAVAALQSVRKMVNETHFDGLLNTLQFTTNVEIRRAAEEALVEIIRSSTQRSQYTSKLHGIVRSSVNDDARHAALRLSGFIADESSLAFIREIFAGRAVKDQIAAISALASWASADGFPVLMSFFIATDDIQLRGRAFDAGIRYATGLDESEADEGTRRDVWTQLASNASSAEEKEKVVRALAMNHRDEWVIGLIESFTKNNNPDRVIDVAERAISSIKARRRQN
jgi:serine/threonine protein kinase